MPLDFRAAAGESVAELILKIVADASQYEKELKEADRVLSESMQTGKKEVKKFSEESESALKKVILSMHKMNNAIEDSTKKMDAIAFNYLKVAAILTGPFIAAAIAVRNTNQQVAYEFGRLQDSSQAISNTMADVLIPYLRIVADWFEKFARKVYNTNPTIKKLVGNILILRGGFLTLKAILIFLGSAFIKVAWAMSKFILASMAITSLAMFFKTAIGARILAGILMFLSRAVLSVGFAFGYLIGLVFRMPFIIAQLVLNVATLIPRLLLLGKVLITGVVMGFKTAMASVIGFFSSLGIVGGILAGLVVLVTGFAIAWIMNWGKVREWTRKFLVWINDALNKFLTTFKKWVDDLKVEAVRTKVFWQNILKGPTEAIRIANKAAEEYRQKLAREFREVKINLGKFADDAAAEVDKMKKKLKGFWDNLWSGDSNMKWLEMLAGWKNGLKEMAEQYGDWGANMKQGAMDMAQSMQSTFSDFFFDAFTGELDDLQDYFASFGRSVLRILSDMIAKWLVVKALSSIGSFGGGFFHEGGLIGPFMQKAHEGLSIGEVPIIAKQGEGIINTNGMATLGKDGLANLNNGGFPSTAPQQNVLVIQALNPDDFLRNKDTILKIFENAMKRNASTRKVVQTYG